MKIGSNYIAILCGLLVFGTITSCNDDDDDDDDDIVISDDDEGEDITDETVKNQENADSAFPENIGYVLNEGSYGSNDACIAYFDADEDTTTAEYYDIFFMQNGIYLGDTGQNLIEYDDNLYVSVYGSSYVARLSKYGVLQTTIDFSDYGQPRYLEAEDGYLYVSCYGGYVVKLDASTLAYVDKVEVGAAPERMVEEGDKLYVALGYTTDLATTDNRMAVIDLESFVVEKYVDVMENAQNVAGDGNYIFIQGYGTDWVNTPVYVYNNLTGDVSDTGYYASFMAVEDNELFAVYSATDWTTYESTNTFYSYNPITDTYTDLTETITSQVSSLASDGIYCMTNGEDDSFYLTTTDYYSYGTVYHFSNSWQLLGSFTSWGVNANSVVVVD